MEKKENLIFGIRAVIEAIKSGKSFDKLYIKNGLQGELIHELFTIIKKHQVHFQYVPLEKINRITHKNHQGVVGYLSLIEYYKLEDIIIPLFEEGKNPILIILDGVTDVRNFGSICRIGECAGVHAIIIPETGSAQINSDAIKTSAGALHHIKICRVRDLEQSVKYLKNSGLKIIAATEKGQKVYYNTDLSLPVAVVFGSEDAGISGKLLKISDEMVTIPILGNIASLNVSAAVSAIIYESVRQRQKA